MATLAAFAPSHRDGH